MPSSCVVYDACLLQ